MLQSKCIRAGLPTQNLNRASCNLQRISLLPRLPLRLPAPQGLHRSSFNRISAAAQQDAPSYSTMEVKEQLMHVVKANPDWKLGGNMPPEVKCMLSSLEDHAEEIGKVDSSKLAGKFGMLLNTTSYVDQDFMSTLGNLTFNQFAPIDQKIRIHDMQLIQGVESPNQYTLRTEFEVMDHIGEQEEENVFGVQLAIGEAEIDETGHRQKVRFLGIGIEPKNEEDKEAFVSRLKEANPDLNEETGRGLKTFDKPIDGHRDFIFCDEDVQITKGNRGSITIVERLH